MILVSRARGRLQEGKRRLQICLELIGERNERIDHLEDDIAEMKMIFRSQICLAADQLDAFRQNDEVLSKNVS